MSRVQLALSLLSIAPVALAGNVQLEGLTLPEEYYQQRDIVKGMFTSSYDAYKKYAWGHDDLSPVSMSYSDGRNGWGASLADAMPTMYIMGLDDLFHEAVDYISGVDFSQSQTEDTVSIFESTIRYVAGMLSAYQLSGEKDDILVEKAKQLADKLVLGWVDGHTVPYGYVNFTSGEPVIDTTNIAEAGTLTLEYAVLSQYTGNSTYEELAVGSAKQIMNTPPPLPGLPAQGYEPSNNTFVGGYVTWGGGSDSYLEYLIKYARLTNTDDNSWVDAWQTGVDSSIKTLLRTSTVGDWLYLADYDSNKKIRHVSSHLACFHGGNWIQGGRMIDDESIVDYGLQLADACWNTYASTATGLGPEVFAFASDDGNYTGSSAPSKAQLDFYEEHGFYITAEDYILRPEVLESQFIAYRATGDTKYLDRAASAVASMNEYLLVNGAFSGIEDVTDKQSARIDDTESFWFAEVLKYLYLIFDDPDHISLDEYVLNTEAQPFKAPPGKGHYGSGVLLDIPVDASLTVGADLPEVSANSFMPVSIKDIIGLDN
ncbi:glycoside hydrolase family 47 protein [Schizophyllum amplum]|uniref:alpha-1,2-Mannosidase n=1 Tax=Schizophyllum amplum TaxID=97359 RepID=A0A550CFM1_9AGAR|nr:glycoside hydrolase family 47 protein [Auriculariopsis ampla]